jgi:TRAP-type C4-dicarboxylate transport system substrate-binding protein
MVNERTKGKVKIEIFPAGTLAKAADIYDGIRSGLFDLGHSYSGYYPGRFPITSVLGLPFLGGSSAEEASLVLWALYDKFPEMRAEYSDVKILTLHSCPAQNLVMAKKAIRKLEDCKGLKLRVPGTAASLAKALGFAPVVMSNSQTYEAIAKGMVDGCFNSWETLKSFRLVEVANFCYRG